jgi:hypothetical protein
LGTPPGEFGEESPAGSVHPEFVSLHSRAQNGSSGTLPFTGLDLGFLVLVGSLLIAAGVVERRALRAK